jgi:hypothetical protein
VLLCCWVLGAGLGFAGLVRLCRNRPAGDEVEHLLAQQCWQHRMHTVPFWRLQGCSSASV